MADQLHIILVPHTHWDREWYQTFQQFRMRLVRTIDKLLDVLDHDDRFTHFMLDGQTIVLDDYLEVQPEREERLKHYTRAGRISVGPWYLQPDEFLVSGEALIRNLQIGLQRAAEFGEPMRVGYVPDCFGHIAQLPQLLQGFGIDSAVFWRGVGAEARQSEFFWAAPDGTRVLVIHLADALGYSNARVMPLAPEEFAARVELLLAPILTKATTNTLLFMNGSDHLEPQAGLPTTIAAANSLLAHINPEHEKLLAVLGHVSPQTTLKPFDGVTVRMGTLPEYIETVRQQNGIHEASAHTSSLQVLSGEMRSSQYAHLLPAVLSTRMWIKQQNTATEHLLEHEMEPLAAWAEQLGAPYPTGLIKLAWKYLLQNHPHDSICGCSIDQVHRENAVRFAQSQQIAEGVIAQAMSAIVAAINTQAPVATTHTSHAPAPIVVFNPGPGPRTEVVQTTVQFLGSLRNAILIDERGEHMPYTVVQRWRQELGSMPFSREIVAAAVALMGVSAPGELIRMAEALIATTLGQPEDTYSIVRVHIEDSPQPGVLHVETMIAPREHVHVNAHEQLAAEQQMLQALERDDITMIEITVIDQARETIEFVATDLPAYGLKTFWMYPRGLKEEVTTAPPDTLTCQPQSIENEWYRVEANTQDGTLTVLDKQTGAVFTGLNRFVDGGDVGDLYTYCPPASDTLIGSPVEPPRIELLHAGPVRATLRVSNRLSLPGSCSANRAERSARHVSCPITSEISLAPGVRRIDITTTVENKVKDHRLRVIFPVPYTVGNVAAEGTFEVRTRPIAAPRPADVAEWAEEPVNTFPQKRFVDISNGTTGLGILNRGLPEYEILQEGPGIATGHMAAAVTLLRCVEWLSRDDLSTRRGHAGPMEYTPEAQCLGEHTFHYALVPHSGAWQEDEALVLRQAQAFNLPVRAILGTAAQTQIHERQEGQQQGLPLPSRTSLIEVEPPELVLSAVKRRNSGKGLVVRLYNPLTHAVEATLRLGVVLSKAFVASLQEEEREQLLWSGETEPLHVGMRAGQITTLLFA